MYQHHNSEIRAKQGVVAPTEFNYMKPLSEKNIIKSLSNSTINSESSFPKYIDNQPDKSNE